MAALCRAEAERLEGRDRPAGWLAIADGFDAIGRPYPAAYAFPRRRGILRHRGTRAEALSALAAAQGDDGPPWCAATGPGSTCLRARLDSM
jgi:hypothetical protein